MTSSEILNIVVTVGVCQLIIDLLSNYMVYQNDPYERACRNMERFKIKLQKAEADLKKSEKKHRKKYERAQADYSALCADVARRHFPPNMLSSIFFVILLRILGTEHKGKVMGVLPFVPYNLISRITSRGLDWNKVISMADNDETILSDTSMHPKQAFSFMFVYLLSGLAIKFYVNKAVGTPPPPGADKGISTIMDSPIGQNVMKSLGIDPDDLKME